MKISTEDKKLNNKRNASVEHVAMPTAVRRHTNHETTAWILEIKTLNKKTHWISFYHRELKKNLPIVRT